MKLQPWLIVLAVTLAAAPAGAVDRCKAKIDWKTGHVLVSASGVEANPVWGVDAASTDVPFANPECFNAATGRLTKCLLGAPDTLAARTPPEGCVIYVNDDADTSCRTVVRYCTAGARLRDESFTDYNDPRGLAIAQQAWQLASHTNAIAALAEADGRQESRLRTLDGATFHPSAHLISADLSNANLAGAHLYGANLTGANLTGANLTGADLSGAELTDADLTGADLSSVDLTGANLRYADLSNANLSGAQLFGANLNGANLTNASLSAAGLNGAVLTGANFTGADLTDADLTDAHLSGAHTARLAGGCPASLPASWQCVVVNGYVNLVGPGANLSNADLSGADLSGADLTGANLEGAELSNANLTGANLSGSHLWGAHISNAALTGASLSGAHTASLYGECPASLPAEWWCLAINGYVNLIGPGAYLWHASLSNAGLSGADLAGAELFSADLSSADLSAANLSGADLVSADLSGANLSGAILTGAFLGNADLSGTNLTGASLSGAVTGRLYGVCPASLPASWQCVVANGYVNLIGPGADLRYADLSNADLSGVDLSGAELSNATATSVIWSNTICGDGSNSDSHGSTCCGYFPAGEPGICSP